MSGLLVGLVFGLLIWVSIGLFFEQSGSLGGVLFFGLVYGLLVGVNIGIKSPLIVGVGFGLFIGLLGAFLVLDRPEDRLLDRLGVGLFMGLLYGSLSGLLGALIGYPQEIKPVEKLRWSWSAVRYKWISKLFKRLGCGLLFGLGMVLS